MENNLKFTNLSYISLINTIFICVLSIVFAEEHKSSDPSISSFYFSKFYFLFIHNKLTIIKY